MIPYVHVPSIPLGPLTLHPFGILVAIAVLVGTWLAMRRARHLGLDESELSSFTSWMLVFGFLGGHVFDMILYRPSEVLSRPLWLLAIWDGQGSYGGFLGALLGILAWRYVEMAPWIETPLGTIRRPRLRDRPRAILPFVDLVLSVFPVAWAFGRLGCSIAHDHPGLLAEPGALLAVAYGSYDPAEVVALPLGIELRYGAAPRYDLGTIELLFSIALATFFALLLRRPRPLGFYVTATALAYAPARFAMDFLRFADTRYASLTPAQYACVVLFACGLVMLVRLRLRRSVDGARDQGWVKATLR